MHRLLLAMLLCGVAGSTTRADGLLYQLPADGTGIKFDLVMQRPQGDLLREIKGTLTMASVGKVEVDGKPCRWIEFHMTTNEGSAEDKIAKLLIPEERLKTGESPLEHVVRAWQREEDDPAEELKDPAGIRTPIPAFLSGPLEEVEKTGKDSITVEGVGTLECDQFTGKKTYGDGDRKLAVTFTTARTKKAPFGVAKCHMDFQIADNRGTVELVWTEAVENATSELPNHR